MGQLSTKIPDIQAILWIGIMRKDITSRVVTTIKTRVSKCRHVHITIISRVCTNITSRQAAILKITTESITELTSFIPYHPVKIDWILIHFLILSISTINVCNNFHLNKPGILLIPLSLKCWSNCKYPIMSQLTAIMVFQQRVRILSESKFQKIEVENYFLLS